MDKKNSLIGAIFMIILQVVLCVGCTTPKLIMKSWVGHTENELYAHWGTPSTTIDNGSNGKIVVYIPDMVGKNGVRFRYSNARQPVAYIGPRNNEYRRTKFFYITPMGTIYAWKWVKPTAPVVP
jgi:hypothetical protein